MPSEAKKISDSVSVRDFDSEARTLQEQIAESERRLAAAVASPLGAVLRAGAGRSGCDSAMRALLLL